MEGILILCLIVLIPLTIFCLMGHSIYVMINRHKLLKEEIKNTQTLSLTLLKKAITTSGNPFAPVALINPYTMSMGLSLPRHTNYELSFSQDIHFSVTKEVFESLSVNQAYSVEEQVTESIYHPGKWYQNPLLINFIAQQKIGQSMEREIKHKYRILL